MSRPLIDKTNELATVRAFTHFTEFVTGDLYTSLAADAGTSVAVGDARGGVCVLTTGATDNNECAVFTTKELFLPADNLPCECISRVQFTEIATDDANVFSGFMNAIGANAMLDDGAGPKASYSGAVIYKVDGETVWRVQSSNATTKTTTITGHTAGGSSYQTLRVLIEPINSTTAEVTFFIDTAGGNNWKQMLDANGRPIKHSLALASLTEMNAGVYVKAGSANSQVVSVDLIDPAQRLF